MKALVLIVTLGLTGCGVGYRCEGPACATDAAVDAGIDAGVRRTNCFGNCYPRCCDGDTGQCSTLSEARCGSDTAENFCVTCGVGQLCVRVQDTGRCETRTSRCATTCLGCCDEAAATCRSTGTANDAGSCI